MNEIWKTVSEIPIYEVSNFGNVRSIDRIDALKRLKLGKELSKSRNAAGYFTVSLSGARKTFLVHRLVAHAFIVKPNNKNYVNHKDGNKENNNVENLEWVSAQENSLHSYYILKRSRLGESHHFHKLNRKSVQIIRDMLKEKRYSQSYLATAFNISVSTIWAIANNKIWKEKVEF